MDDLDKKVFELFRTRGPKGRHKENKNSANVPTYVLNICWTYCTSVMRRKSQPV